MQAVDKRAIEKGIDSYALMQAAGDAVSRQVMAVVRAELDGHTPTILVLVGPGNNGGDGAIAAQVLREAGFTVNLLLAIKAPASDTDAARALSDYEGNIHPVDEFDTLLDHSNIIIDALFGAGLSRPLSGAVAAIVEKVNESSAPVVSVDVPSGLDGNTNTVQVPCVCAHSTVTFFRYKPVHFLYPGRQLCGKLVLAPIGLQKDQLDEKLPYCSRNSLQLFKHCLPQFDDTAHKFDRGHVLVRSGPIQSTGAARLSAATALFTGAGLVTVASNNEALAVNAAHLTAVMLKRCDTLRQWKRLIKDSRINTVLVGPGNGISEATRQATLAALGSAAHCVVDADALSCWQTGRGKFIEALNRAPNWPVLTPHAGEFERVFADTPVMDQPSKLHQARWAARLSASVVIYKGADTVIAAPDGRTAINSNAPSWLATAGSGDVLAGSVAALIAQGMPAFEAACASVWLHGQAGRALGNPLCAEQLVTQIGRELSKYLLR
jgi:NAD(P)H-hydrate epimerase